VSFTGYKATSTTIGRPAIGERKNYVYRGGKPLRDEPPPATLSGKSNSRRKQARLDRFEVILAELAGGLEHAQPEHIRRAGELSGVGEKTARGYLRAILRREESPS
jgi:hypothetical protein